jgi:hypothetical protein
MEHVAFEAISLFSNPSFSKASIKICYAASSSGSIIVDDTKALTLAGWKNVEGRRNGRLSPILPFQGTSLYKPYKPQAYPAAP